MATSTEICPICGEGSLEHKVAYNAVEYGGHESQLGMQYSECSSCRSEQSNALQLRKNKRAMTQFKKQVDGLLTGQQVRKIREGLGINQIAAARIFGGGPVAFSKYEADDITQSAAMDKLLRLAHSLPAAFKVLALDAGVELESGEKWERVPVRFVSRRLRLVSLTEPQNESTWKAA